ncbi:MAG TPA: hypothetical protein VJR87_03460 [Allosphingosinicella sp.]|nr:hypothetical protein [Allosphingosinicella sp.]HKT14442.1 hypothetical protein [Allosphingosinicella sp.]
MKRILVIAALASLAAAGGCKRGDSSGVTAEESAGLNNAADMLDTSPDSLVANDQTPLGNGDEAIPADESAAGNGAAQ